MRKSILSVTGQAVLTLTPAPPTASSAQIWATASRAEVFTLGSDMGDSITGGGLHGKDLSKADVSVNIYLWLAAQKTGKTVEL